MKTLLLNQDKLLYKYLILHNKETIDYTIINKLDPFNYTHKEIVEVFNEYKYDITINNIYYNGDDSSLNKEINIEFVNLLSFQNKVDNKIFIQLMDIETFFKFNLFDIYNKMSTHRNIFFVLYPLFYSKEYSDGFNIIKDIKLLKKQNKPEFLISNNINDYCNIEVFTQFIFRLQINLFNNKKPKYNFVYLKDINSYSQRQLLNCEVGCEYYNNHNNNRIKNLYTNSDLLNIIKNDR